MAHAASMAFGKYRDFLGYLRPSWFKHQWRSVHWMNQRATPDKAYVPAPVEHIANVITHGISILPSAYGSIVLLSRSTNWVQFTAAAVYGISLVLCFAVSTAFHCFFYTGKNRFLKEILHRGDRAMIYVFIAASYFPWLLLRPLPAHSLVSTHLWWIVWALAFFGIAYQQLFHEKYKNIGTMVYVMVALGPALVVLQNKCLTRLEETRIIKGGLIYLAGIFFFKCDGIFPCAHAIWHLFVTFAASIHFFAILDHLY
uniref:Monocyte to macrophage differentiation protein n=1 Tax=Lygus hesperus TaxID=30085 RepID=A0A0A9WG73_LYGHE